MKKPWIIIVMVICWGLIHFSDLFNRPVYQVHVIGQVDDNGRMVNPRVVGIPASDPRVIAAIAAIKLTTFVSLQPDGGLPPGQFRIAVRVWHDVVAGKWLATVMIPMVDVDTNERLRGFCRNDVVPVFLSPAARQEGKRMVS